MRAEETEATSTRLFDVPAHMYRAAAGDAWRWLTSLLAGRADEAFWHETQLRFFAGFFRKRQADFLANELCGGRELAAFMRPRANAKNDRGATGEVN